MTIAPVPANTKPNVPKNSERSFFNLLGFHRKSFLFLRFFQFIFPFLDAADRAAEREEFFLVVNHLGARQAGERIIFLKKNRLFRTDFLAKAAENAAQHVDLERLRHLFRVRAVSELSSRT